ncbi:MAG: FtsX-like permease family protein [Spirochaetales bacterium]|nr:FtsX-like permease family protein [Spirochaetales bacterium]
MIFIIAFRNLFKSIRHTLIVVFLIMVIIALFYIGNTVLEESNNGLRTTYILNYTGDIVIQEKTDVSMSLFGANTPAIGEFFSIPVLNDVDTINALAADFEEVETITRQISGPAVLDIGTQRFGVPVFGIDPDTYFPCFPGIQLDAGRFLQSGEMGAMLTKGRAEQVKKDTGVPVSVGDSILLSTAGTTGFKIREVPVVGIFSYSNAVQIPDEIVLTDAQTARALNSILLATDSDYAPPETTVDILTDDIDSLFMDEGSDTIADKTESVSLAEIKTLLETGTEPVTQDWKDGGWNFIILRLKKGVNDSDFLKKLNEKLEPFTAKAVDWRTAAGTPALLVLLLQYLFNAGLLLIIIAGIIAIINILLITVFQRMKEIGTLRAIGASDGYVRLLIFTENIIIAAIAGILGIVLGNVLIQVINGMGISVNNSLISSMLGHDRIFIQNSGLMAIASVALSVVLGFLSSIYPVQIALRIQPVEAVAKG